MGNQDTDDGYDDNDVYDDDGHTGCLLRSSGGERSLRPSSGSYGNLAE